MSAARPPTLVAALPDDAALGAALARSLRCDSTVLALHRFPDGEALVRLDAPLKDRRVVLAASLRQPDAVTLPLLFAADAARELGARQVGLVAPYLAYMRQDIAFHPGEAVSQRIVGRFLADLFDAVITVDPHLHRVATLHDAVPAARTEVLSGAPLLADLIALRRPGALLVGPDSESAQWVSQAAARHGFEHAVCAKRRQGDHVVEIQLPAHPVAGRAVVLLDDVASTGHTLAQAARLLRAAGAATVDVAVTHALFAGDAEARLREAGVGEIWSTDCIAHPSNAVFMADALAQALASMR